MPPRDRRIPVLWRNQRVYPCGVHRRLVDHLEDVLLQADWVSRHERWSWMMHNDRRTADIIAWTLGPGILLHGTSFPMANPETVIKLPDRIRNRQITLEEAIRNVRRRLGA